MIEAIRHPAYGEEKQHLKETVEYIRQKVDDLDQLLLMQADNPVKIEILKSQKEYRQKLENIIANHISAALTLSIRRRARRKRIILVNTALKEMGRRSSSLPQGQRRSSMTIYC